MNLRPKPFVRILSWFRLVTVMFALVICVGTIVLLYFEVWAKSRDINSRITDNSYWILAQADIQILELELAIHHALENTSPDLENLRQRYSDFYDRVDVLKKSNDFQMLHFSNGFEKDAARLTRFFEDTMAFIEGPDDQLIANLPELLSQTQDAHAYMLAITSTGLEAFAAKADANRNEMSDALSRLGMLTTAQVAILMMLILALLRMLQVGDRQAREQALSRERLEVMVSTAIDAILVVGHDGKIQNYNGAAERVFGYKREDVLGREMSDLIVPPHLREAHREGMKRFLKTGVSEFVGGGTRNLEAMDANGRIFPIEISVNKAQSEGGLIFIAYARDISGRLSAEKALVEARDHAVAGEKAKARLLAVMSHEMRTPLNGLIGTLELLENSELDEKQCKHIANMHVSSGLLLQHVNDVLDVSRLDAEGDEVPITTFDGVEIMEEVLDIQSGFAAARGTVLENKCIKKDLRGMRGDPRSLRQVLLNLVGNAVKFTLNGSVTIESERLPDSRWVEFRVIDTGRGIAEEDLPRIFDDFVTLDASYGRQTGGTGLGLGITRRLVEAMGGQIGVESELGEGSLFWFRLPVATKAQRSEEAPEEPSSEETLAEVPEAMKVLLVEDNEINRLVAREFLQLEGCIVTEAPDGQTAVDLAKQRGFDLILMDISMPGMDGVEATRAIRARKGPNEKTRIVALTAHAMEEEVARFLKAGMSQVVVKPATRAVLRGVLAGSPLPKLGVSKSGDTLVEWTTLKEMEGDLGRARAEQLTRAYVRETDQVLDALCRDAESTGTEEECAEVLHRLAGSSAMFGALVLREAFLDMESLFRAGCGDEALSRKDDLKSLWASTRSELINFCETELVNS
ncbi:hybrid sensor histidine kinase/response regulator [Actibacterium pelagium]|uniref:histidine kinase n=1 Tax=Actibacterium pelagium TaxID=2029103 RepID=A0A917EG71_9RHOB|nr:PAS domain-containing hybrid sensor histidine kinase/response regulator [Actibacterium pelagium]GGE37290.1 hybrid sensor histidine kinase/response regulator [Actibacterium pelagium]